MFCQYVCSLGIEPTTFALLTQCSTTEPQEHGVKYVFIKAIHYVFILNITLQNIHRIRIECFYFCIFRTHILGFTDKA